jgi:hypothetical protein
MERRDFIKVAVAAGFGSAAGRSREQGTANGGSTGPTDSASTLPTQTDRHPLVAVRPELGGTDEASQVLG